MVIIYSTDDMFLFWSYPSEPGLASINFTVSIYISQGSYHSYSHPPALFPFCFY